MKTSITEWIKGGTPWIWLTAGAVSISLIMVVGLLLLIAARGLGQFWPGEVVTLEYQIGDHEKTSLLGEIVGQEKVNAPRLREQGIDVPEDVDRVDRFLLKRGNRNGRTNPTGKRDRNRA